MSVSTNTNYQDWRWRGYFVLVPWWGRCLNAHVVVIACLFAAHVVRRTPHPPRVLPRPPFSASTLLNRSVHLALPPPTPRRYVIPRGALICLSRCLPTSCQNLKQKSPPTANSSCTSSSLFHCASPSVCRLSVTPEYSGLRKSCSANMPSCESAP